MVCIYCGEKTKVTNSRGSRKTLITWRRRECLGCSAIFTTRERIDLEETLMVKKPANDLQPFWRDKLFVSVNNSLSHRKTALKDATELTDTVITRLKAIQRGGILNIEVLAAETHATLERFDHSASVHYKAHYG